MIDQDKIISNNHLPNLVILTRQSSMWITRTILAWTTMSQCQSPLTILPWPTPSQRPPPRQLAARGYPPLDLDSAIAAPITTPSSPCSIAPQHPTGGIAPPPAITSRRCPPPHMESTASPSPLRINRALMPIVGAASPHSATSSSSSSYLAQLSHLKVSLKNTEDKDTTHAHR